MRAGISWVRRPYIVIEEPSSKVAIVIERPAQRYKVDPQLLAMKHVEPQVHARTPMFIDRGDSAALATAHIPLPQMYDVDTVLAQFSEHGILAHVRVIRDPHGRMQAKIPERLILKLAVQLQPSARSDFLQNFTKVVTALAKKRFATR